MTTGEYGIEMSETATADFLTRHGHGVLSFGGDLPYGLPISFGYDEAENRCIFQLLFHPESKKRAYLTESNAANLVAYEWADVDNWRSVVIDGQLSQIDIDSDDAIEAAEVFAEYGSVVGLTVFDRPIEELQQEWYELEIEEMQGYQSPVGIDPSDDE